MTSLFTKKRFYKTWLIVTLVMCAVFGTVPVQAFDDFYSDSEIQFFDPDACDPTGKNSESTDPAAEPEGAAASDSGSTKCCNSGDPTANVDGSDEELNALLKKLADQSGGKTTISVGSIDGNTRADEGGNTQMPTRSSYKIYVAYATLKAIEDHKISWSSTVHKASGNDGAFSSGSVEQAMERMIVNSDNAAASALRTDPRIGNAESTTDLLHKAGLSDGTVMGSGNASDALGTNSKSTANDFSQFLIRLQKHKLPGVTTEAYYNKLFGYMKRATTDGGSARDGIVKGVGGGTTVADKPGWGSDATNDVGIVYLDNNPYVISVLTDKSVSGAAWANIAKIASKVNDAMAEGKTSDPAPTPGPGGGTAPAPTTVDPDHLVGTTDAEKAYNYFIAKGLSPAASAGIVGNLMQETGGGSEDLHPESRGSHNGIAQWDSGRFGKLQSFISKKGGSVNELGWQLEYLWQELTTGYRGTYSQLKKAKSAEGATRAFDIGFEASGECKGGTAGCDKRIKYAKEMLKKYGDGKGGSATDEQEATTCTCEDPSAAPSAGTSEPTKDLEGFVKKYAQMTLDASKKAGVPYDALLAQMAIESGNGSSELTAKYNNFGGIKAQPGQKSVSLPTTEVIGGATVHVNAKFRVFDSPEDGIANQAKFFTSNSRYKEALKYPKNPERFIKEVAKAGYATDPNYATTLIRVLHSVQSVLKSMNLPLSKDVEPDTKPAGGDQSDNSDAVIQGDCTSGAISGDAAATAVKYAWPKYRGNKPEQQPAYKKATAKAKDAGKYIGGGVVDGNDCGAFVTRVMQDSGVDPKYGDKGPTGTQLAYMKKNKDKYEERHPSSDADLQPGDIAVSSNHTYMFVGKSANFEGTKASASIPNRAPMAAPYENMSDSHGTKFAWFRVK